MSFITGKHVARRTMLRGLGATVALPFLDAMVPARGLFAGRPPPPRSTGRGWCASGWCTAPPAPAVGRRAAPVVAGGGRARLRPRPTSLSPLEAYRKHLTIVSDTDVRNAEAFAPPEIGGDHFRSSAVFLTQAHPQQTESSDVRAGVSLDQIYAQKFGQDTRSRRCSCASRTWTRPAAAPTAIPASTPT